MQVSPYLYIPHLFKTLYQFNLFYFIFRVHCQDMEHFNCCDQYLSTSLQSSKLCPSGARYFLLPSLPFFLFAFLFRTNTCIQVDGTTSFSKLKVMAEGGGSRTVTLTPTWTQFTLLLNASGLNAPSPFGGNSHKFQFQNNQASMSFYFGRDEGRDEGRGGRDEWITYFV